MSHIIESLHIIYMNNYFTVIFDGTLLNVYFNDTLRPSFKISYYNCNINTKAISMSLKKTNI